MVAFGAPILRHRLRRARGHSVRRDVIRDVAVDAEHLGLRLLALEVGEIRRPCLLDSDATARRVHDTLVARQREGLAHRIGGHVLP